MEFKDLLIIPQIQKALVNQQYTTPTPIQEKAIPPIMEGRDVLGCAQTGTGKTAAYALPILQHLYLQSQSGTPGLAQRRIRALILCPTRELALQIYESFCAYGQYTGLRYCAVFGGVSQKPQEIALKRGVDILIATPGRLDDLMNQGLINLGHVEILTLDEADMMLDMGFIQAVKKIIAKIPEVRQTLFFSATMPPEIVELSKTIQNHNNTRSAGRRSHRPAGLFCG
jgi:ATP-dependent RNA helicase RhlE